ncbi:hypothetical protein V6R21_00240 [Limibacter armeniacum]|uniref:hypothetical protein n=1 Tax=Limibacter armeniacum TaxID=466084 RepID=UPI002FE6BCEC
MKKYINNWWVLCSLLLLGVTACEEQENEVYQGAAYVSLVDTDFNTSEDAEGALRVQVRLTTTSAVNAPLEVTYKVEGDAGWESRIKDESNGKVTIASGEYTADIFLMPINNEEIDNDVNITVTLTGVSGAAVNLGLGKADSYVQAAVFLSNEDKPEYNSCIAVSEVLLENVVNLAYTDFYDSAKYSGTDPAGLIVEPSDVLACNKLRVTGDALALFAGAFDIEINEEKGTVNIPQQKYGSKDGEDYYIVAIEEGTIDITSGEISVNILWFSYAKGTDPSTIDLLAEYKASTYNYYDGNLKISLGAYSPCTALGEAFLNKAVTLDYEDEDPDYSGNNPGVVLEPNTKTCNRILVKGDAINYYDGEFELLIDEENNTVEVPLQLYSVQDNDTPNYYIQSSAGTYDPATQTIVIDFAWSGYADGANPDPLGDGYVGKLTITLAE